MLFGCIYCPDFPVQAALRGSPPLFLSSAAAVLDGPESLLKVIACNDLARDAGIEVGMTKIQAESFGEVLLQKRVAEQEDATQAALLACGYNFSPHIEFTAPGTIIVDLTGTERLLGPALSIGQQMAEHCCASCFDVSIGIAANPDAALCAARGFRGITVIPPGKEAVRLAGLPIQVLQASDETLETLANWGIHTFAALAALPAIALSERLGQDGLHLQNLARGTVQRELVPVELSPSFEESTELEEPVELLDPLSFILNRLLEDLTDHLRQKSLATDHLELDLTLEVHQDREVHASVARNSSAATYQRELKLPIPTCDSKVLLKLLQLDLAAHPPQAPVKRIRVRALPACPRPVQGGLFQALAPEPAKLEVTVARLRSVVGEKDLQDRGRVGFPAIVDSHRPDHFQVLPFAGVRENNSERPALPQCALRLFRPAIPARIELSADEAPCSIGFSRKKARVNHASGPWRCGGGWWNTGEWRREEWDLELIIGGAAAVYRVFRDLVSKRWFVEGMYD